MSRCPICGSKECCGGYYQEVQDVLVETLGIVLSLIDEFSEVVGYSEEVEAAIRVFNRFHVHQESEG